MLHSHNFYEFLYCNSTGGVEYLVGADRYRLQRGDVILIPPGISHCPLVPEQLTEPYRRDVLWISPEMIDQLEEIIPAQERMNALESRLLRTAGTRWEFIGEMFHHGVREFEGREPGWEEIVLGNTIQILVYLRRAIKDRSASPLIAEKPELLDQVLAYVETHLAERITLGDIAKHFWVSQSTISQVFRNKMGVSFYRCVTQRRLIAAKSLIIEGLPLEAVGQRVGFSDYSSFYRAFKQEFGISPRQFRKMQETDHSLS
jgi:AraC-like DNA-binding protein